MLVRIALYLLPVWMILMPVYLTYMPQLESLEFTDSSLVSGCGFVILLAAKFIRG